jgi:hypothetical protein
MVCVRTVIAGGGYSAVLKVSYVQVFGDEVTDLLYTPPAAPRAAAAAAGGGGAVEGGDEDDAVASAPVMTLTAAHTVRSGALDREVCTALPPDLSSTCCTSPLHLWCLLAVVICWI